METMRDKVDIMKSLNKSLDLLEFISGQEREIGILEISKQLGMGLSTVHRILTTLKIRGYVIQNEKTSKYRLGMKLLELGCEIQNVKFLVDTIKPFLIKLSASTNETSNLAILEGKEVVYLAKSESTEVLTTNIKIGTRLPAHCTSLGKAILAFLNFNKFELLYQSDKPLISLTTKSISSIDKLKKELKKVKEQGYAVDMEEYKIGINCVGVPIFNRNEEVIAAISITGPSLRLTIDKIEIAKNNLIIASKEISKIFCRK